MCCLWVAVDLPLDYFILCFRILEDGWVDERDKGELEMLRKYRKEKKINNE